MNFFPPPPPPPPQPPQPVFNTANSGGVYELTQAQISDIGDDTSSSSSSSLTSSIIIVSIVISSIIFLSITIYALIRFISRRFSNNTTISEPPSPPTSGNPKMAPPSCSRFDKLPLFKFGSVTGNLTGGEDCAVCLSKFESNNKLRLLPLCCHAFHADCIDTWLSNNHTCPLCRSSVYPTDSAAANIISSSLENGGSSFRIEIGSVSQRRRLLDEEVEVGRGRSYSIGSFDYIVDNGFEIPLDSVTKEYIGGIVVEAPPGESLAGEVGSGRNWLKDYVERLTSFSVSSQSTSFRSSGRFFGGSSRRNDVVVPVDHDLEANRRVGEEISEMFRWISGV